MFEEQHFINLISNMGFPIVISIYLLHRFEKKLDSLENAIQNLIKVINSPKKEE
ncbi:YvrJ family protein [Ornithinibacillus xuwenensis]|uniref:YvrJ family protein n=1 Tax=Ornithinibacillus xuwenensis TaxID=3144668 RepID=A0ABU9XGD1_9BACI